ncbi:hypothetical protein FB567DRAFT_605670 [Paraphoma chrysanthemicola]|uniref:Uncharacterized protein n=1 Tax=Paraphoma chrysanthemicola TaxID=798071 RepID=A0A8K0R0W7_9PLEO|nr:hypothetical protein FB567DRAFT_605670 [Paraphoma chrysanthemicola]
MVLYHPDGRVDKAHEDYLERQAQEDATKNNYDDQIDVVKNKLKARMPSEEDSRVQIVVDEQHFKELYYHQDSELKPGVLPPFDNIEEGTYPKDKTGLDRNTLIACSSTAEDYFAYEPDGNALHLPVCYPRKRNLRDIDNQMALIRGQEIENYLVPWLQEIERHVLANSKDPKTRPVTKGALKELKAALPEIRIPEELLEKIHLYNVMLQLGIRSYFQRPLIDALVLHMYRTRLNQCHLDTLELTVCRFYSRGIAVLDPVLNHLIGTYAFRSLNDRQNPRPSPAHRSLPDDMDEAEDERLDTELYLPKGTKRLWLDYSNVRPNDRTRYPNDTVILPPRLEVLAHCIRHWSGVRRNGSTVAAHTGYPLNVGRVRKYYRRGPTSPIRHAAGDKGVHYVDYSTYRLRKTTRYSSHGPGSVTDSESQENT